LGEQELSIDHVDGNGLNNQKANLRVASHAENCANRRINRNNTSGFKGVSKNKERWQAYIRVAYRQIHLGYFDTPEEAAEAYDRAAIAYFGEFAKTNKMLAQGYELNRGR